MVGQQILGLFDEPQETPKPQAHPDSLAHYDWIVVNSSGGKDSQAMLDLVCERAETEGVVSRVVVVHADLGRVEWAGTREIAQAQADCYDVPFVAVWRKQGDLLNQIESRGKFPGPATRFCTAHHKQNQVGRVLTALSAEQAQEKTAGDLLTQIEERGKFPDAARRYCTSDHKRAQVHRLFTRLTDKFRAPLEPIANSIRPCRILNCLGMRAEESPRRSKMLPFEPDTAASNGKREVTRWLPLHGWTEAQVWERLRSCRSREHIHYAYDLGMPRVSCCFCIFAPKEALIIAGHHNPELLAEYVRVEEKIGHKFRQNLSMAQVKAAVDAGEVPQEVPTWKM